MFSRKPWLYGEQIKNRNYLEDYQSFEDLIKEISGEMKEIDYTDVRFRIEPTNGKYSGDEPHLKRLQCRRSSWHIPMKKTLLDKFYNGKEGIRAQYYRDPYHGLAMNQEMITSLKARLIRLAEQCGCKELDFVNASLSGSSAKVWISEKNLENKKIIRASDLTLVENEIDNDWLDVARMVKNGEINSLLYQRYCASLNGVRAPIPDQLEVKGAWISANDWIEYVTPDKYDRHCQLFMFGFT